MPTVLNEIIPKQYMSPSARIRRSVNQLQLTMHCCGVENYTDWLSAAKETNHKSIDSIAFPELAKLMRYDQNVVIKSNVLSPEREQRELKLINLIIKELTVLVSDMSESEVMGMVHQMYL